MTNEFNYYIHKTGEKDYTKFFKNGLYNFDTSFRIESTMEKLFDADLANGLIKRLKTLRDGDQTVLLIKIPKDYFPKTVHRNGKMDVPIPIFYEKNMNNPYGVNHDYPVLIPNLIQGCYSKKDGFITNEDYCPVYDPSGLKYGYEQLEQIKNNDYTSWQNYNKRNIKGNFQTLYQFDKSSKVWEPFIQYYSKKLGVAPVIPYDGNYEQNNTKNGMSK